MAKRVGIIGLGRIGMPSAKAFIRAGYEVVGYARRPEVIEEFKSIGGEAASHPQEVAQKAETAIVLVLNAAQVQARNIKLPLYVATSAYQYFLAAVSQGMEHMEGGIGFVRRGDENSKDERSPQGW